MEGERKQNDTTCRGGCGFFGSSATNGLCSLCYKQQLAKMNAAPASSAQSPAQVMASTSSPSIIKAEEERDEGSLNLSKVSQDLFESGSSAELDKESLAKVTTTELPVEDGMLAKKADKEEESKEDSLGIDKKSKTNRCATCRKKVGLLGFECRCGGLFCGTHRYSDKHECSFDYREYGKNEIQKNNPVVVAEKIKKL